MFACSASFVGLHDRLVASKPSATLSTQFMASPGSHGAREEVVWVHIVSG